MMRQRFTQNSFQLCVDGYNDGVLKARLYHRTLDTYVVIMSIEQLILTMEHVLAVIDFPSIAHNIRRFRDCDYKYATVHPENNNNYEYAIEKGKYMNFSLQIIYRQNTSLQGDLLILDKNKSTTFKSELELIKQLYFALSKGEHF